MVEVKFGICEICGETMEPPKIKKRIQGITIIFILLYTKDLTAHKIIKFIKKLTILNF